MDTKIQSDKIELIQWLTTLDDATMIEKIMDLKDNVSSQLSDAELMSIDKGIRDADEGKLRPHIQAKKIYGKWL